MNLHRSALAVVLVAVLAAAGCGSKSTSTPATSPAGTTTATTAAGPASSAAGSSTSSAVGDAGSSAPAASSASAGSSSASAGSSSADDDATSGPAPVFVNAPAADGVTLTITDGKFTQDSINVKIGSTVTIATTDSKLYSVIVGELQSYTITKTVPEHFKFTGAGTYDVLEEQTQQSATVVAG